MEEYLALLRGFLTVAEEVYRETCCDHIEELIEDMHRRLHIGEQVRVVITDYLRRN